MDLKRNICDSVKECEIKLGYREEAISLYYPESALLELLPASAENLADRLQAFCTDVSSELGEVVITETKEKGRYCVTVPVEGVAYVHSHIEASPFLVAFLQEIHRPGNTREAIIALFRQFSENVIVEKMEEREWAVYFENPSVDAYVYYIEEDDFGLQYHRFTREAFEDVKK